MKSIVAVAIVVVAPSIVLAQGGTYAKEGVRLTAGSVPEIARIGGVYRLYFCSPGGIRSAISSDGLTFLSEPGVRIASGGPGSEEEIVGDPSIVQLPGGLIRMYYKGGDGPGGPGQANHRIFSATSTDGVAFTKEGKRFENMGYPDWGWTSVPDAVRLPDGRIRIYYTGGQGVESCVSGNGLDFVLEPGVRIAGSVDPDAVLLASGDVAVFHAVGLPAQSIAVSRSANGLDFTLISTILTAGGPNDPVATIDPSAVRLPNGRWRVYYGAMQEQNRVVTASAISPTVIQRPIDP